MKLYNPEQQYNETRIGSGIFKNAFGKIVQAPSVKSLKQYTMNEGQRLGDVGANVLRNSGNDASGAVLAYLNNRMQKPTNARDVFKDSKTVANIGKNSLKNSLKNNISNAYDNEAGKYRANVRALLDDPGVQKTVQNELVTALNKTKISKKATPALSELLQKSSSKRSTKKGQGLTPFGRGVGVTRGKGIAYI